MMRDPQNLVAFTFRQGAADRLHRQGQVIDNADFIAVRDILFGVLEN